MKSLAERHDDRAQRRADNQMEPGYLDPVPTPSLNTVLSAYINYREVNSLFERAEARHPDSPALRRLAAEIKIYEEQNADSGRSLAEAPDGSGNTMAGIGVVNTQVVPAAVFAVSDAGGKGLDSSEDPAWGEHAPVTEEGLPEPTPLDEGNNISGQSLADQLGKPGGWGTQGSKSSADLRDEKPKPTQQPAKAPDNKDNK